MIIKGQTKITRDGVITNRTINGTFPAGANLLEAIARILMDQGVTLDVRTPPEQHKHGDDDLAHAHDHAHTH